MSRYVGPTSASIIRALGYTPASAGAVVMADGSVGSPGMFFGLDTDTGFYRIAANTLGISAGGTNVGSLSPTLATVGGYTTDISTGYLGLSKSDPNYWIDFSETYTDIGPAAAKHFFHMYGQANLVGINDGGEMTGFYSHMDGGSGVTAGKTIDNIYALRGNLTWGPPGTLTLGAGVYAGARVNNTGGALDGSGTIATAIGGRFEAATETTSTGTITSGYGVWGEVRNGHTSGGPIVSATGLFSYVRSQSTGSGITTGYGARFVIQDDSPGIGTYYGIYMDTSIVPADGTRWGYYSPGLLKSWHKGGFAIGATTYSNSSRLYVNEDAAAVSSAILLASHASFTGDVLRVQAGPASSQNYDLIVAETNANSSAGAVFKVDGLGHVGIGSSSLTGFNLRLSLGLTGAATSRAMYSSGVIQSDATGAIYFDTSASTVAASFTVATLVHYQASQGTIGSGSAVTSQYGFYVSSSLTGASNNYGVRSDIAAGSGRYNFYAGGSADNFFTGAVSGASSITSTSSSAGVGYASGAGGTVTQLTDKSTAVTLDKICGRIALNNATLNANTSVTFTLNNSTVSSTDGVNIWFIDGAGTPASYQISRAVGSGVVKITLTNITAGNLGEALVLGFHVIKGAAS